VELLVESLVRDILPTELQREIKVLYMFTIKGQIPAKYLLLDDSHRSQAWPLHKFRLWNESAHEHAKKRLHVTWWLCDSSTLCLCKLVLLCERNVNVHTVYRKVFSCLLRNADIIITQCCLAAEVVVFNVMYELTTEYWNH